MYKETAAIRNGILRNSRGTERLGGYCFTLELHAVNDFMRAVRLWGARHQRKLGNMQMCKLHYYELQKKCFFKLSDLLREDFFFFLLLLLETAGSLCTLLKYYQFSFCFYEFHILYFHCNLQSRKFIRFTCFTIKIYCPLTNKFKARYL